MVVQRLPYRVLDVFICAVRNAALKIKKLLIGSLDNYLIETIVLNKGTSLFWVAILNERNCNSAKRAAQTANR